ncbi:nucleotidyltransferase family protein [Chondromyces apiculatus]|uniref:Purine catabolism protein PucB n=1 Tax=Chondromyces apiculatus DSM 436 TaxID=1192034 RepID=A0A017T7X8_9BACT|nr:nucleotidyltransferase family protein [Chondromyces apiculatus]EYF04696.1 purine catabolism protein PucB [Chondromyces apiculatus DSM 436]
MKELREVVRTRASEALEHAGHEALLAHTAVVVLAAGASRRLGSPKQLAEVGGMTLLARTLTEATQVGAQWVIVVLGPRDAQDGQAAMVEEARRFGVRVVFNEAAAEGLSASLRCGLAEARLLDAQLGAVLVTLCDQPRVSGALFRRLVAAVAAGPEPIAASSYAGVCGVPAVFTAGVFKELAALEGDEGARRVLRRDPARVRAVAFEEGVLDVDSREDLGRAIAEIL